MWEKGIGKSSGSKGPIPKQRGANLEAERQATATLQLSHTEIRLEKYTGKIFQSIKRSLSRLPLPANLQGRLLFQPSTTGLPAHNNHIWLNILSTSNLRDLRSQDGDLLIFESCHQHSLTSMCQRTWKHYGAICGPPLLICMCRQGVSGQLSSIED